jgi:hypothetical protein
MRGSLGGWSFTSRPSRVSSFLDSLRIGDLIPQIKLHRWIASGATIVAILLLGAYAAAAAPATAPLPPANDAYLNSIPINCVSVPPFKRCVPEKMKLDRVHTIKDVVNTTSATVQSNIFDPCGQASCPTGPAELTTCHGVQYGNTIWYDFYPDADGTVRIRTSGFDNAITLYQFNDNPNSFSYLLPNVAHKQCAHASSFPSEELDAQVTKGRAYTIQIGGVNGASGMLQFLFDYFVPPPGRLQADSTLDARGTSNGIALTNLTVNTIRQAEVSVSCGRFCRPESKIGRAIENFSDLAGIQLPAGAKVIIRVTAPDSIGVYIQYTIEPSNFSKVILCTEPGSNKPRNTCH